MTTLDRLAERETIHLVACDERRNIRRSYSIERSIDLFGFNLVEWRWSRIGANGQKRRRAFADKVDADRHVRLLLRRRSSAPKRLGVAYVDAS